MTTIKAQWRDQRRNWNTDELSVAARTNPDNSYTAIHLQCDGALIHLDYLNAERLAEVLINFLNQRREPTGGFERLTC